MIVIATMFFNEHRLLALRLAEELPCIDRMYVGVSDRTFTRKRKARRDIASPAGWPAAVRSLCVDFQSDNPWDNEALQRNAPTAELLQLGDDTVVVVCDLDECFRGDQLADLAEETQRVGYLKLRLRNHYYKLNYVTDGELKYCDVPFACTVGYLRSSGQTLHGLRHVPIRNCYWRETGHHFDYAMTALEVSRKLKAFSHVEYGCRPFTDTTYIASAMAEGRDLFQRFPGAIWRPEPLNETYPQTILDHQQEWSDLIAPVL